jgi:Spy/CpxP family protein refolding chaperone
MKLKILLLCAGLFLVNGTIQGQQPRPGNDPVGDNLFPPELIMQNQKAIGLEEAQKSYIVSEISKAQGHFTELQWQLQEAMETLGTLLKRDAPDEEQVLAQLDKVLNLEREIKRAQITLMVRIKNKLTSAQQARLRDVRSKSQGN